jgi:hypothetical protein
MTYVSCSPYSVPVAWVAAAQAQIAEPRPANRSAHPRAHQSARKRGKERRGRETKR